MAGLRISDGPTVTTPGAIERPEVVFSGTRGAAVSEPVEPGRRDHYQRPIRPHRAVAQADPHSLELTYPTLQPLEPWMGRWGRLYAQPHQPNTQDPDRTPVVGPSPLPATARRRPTVKAADRRSRRDAQRP